MCVVICSWETKQKAETKTSEKSQLTPTKSLLEMGFVSLLTFIQKHCPLSQTKNCQPGVFCQAMNAFVTGFFFSCPHKMTVSAAKVSLYESLQWNDYYKWQSLLLNCTDFLNVCSSVFHIVSFKQILTDHWNNYRRRKTHQVQHVALHGSDKTLLFKAVTVNMFSRSGQTPYDVSWSLNIAKLYV